MSVRSAYSVSPVVVCFTIPMISFGTIVSICLPSNQYSVTNSSIHFSSPSTLRHIFVSYQNTRESPTTTAGFATSVFTAITVTSKVGSTCSKPRTASARTKAHHFLSCPRSNVHNWDPRHIRYSMSIVKRWCMTCRKLSRTLRILPRRSMFWTERLQRKETDGNALVVTPGGCKREAGRWIVYAVIGDVGLRLIGSGCVCFQASDGADQTNK
jgi:hypothetical protein